MSIVNGNVSTFGLNSNDLIAPEVVFTPTEPAFSGSKFLLSAKPVVAPVSGDGSGAFTANLAPSTATRPPTQYKVQIRSLNPVGGYIYADFLTAPVVVPPEGGDIADLAAAPLNFGMVWITDDGVEPPGSKTGDLIWNTTTDDITKIN